MPPLVEVQLPLAVAAGVFLLVMLAERLHQRRSRIVAHLATGPAGRPRAWVRHLPWVKAAALGAMAGALAALWQAGSRGYRAAEGAEEAREHRHHVMFLADLSPSMQLRDAGPKGDQTRAQRMYEVVDAVLQRIDGEPIYSVMAFYTDAMPVIIDADDSELVRNVFNGLPIWHAMDAGKTDLGTGVRKTFERLAPYPDANTTVFICTDGDTVPPGPIPRPPRAVCQVYVLGVGDTRQGTFIDGHMSRQEPSVLGGLAGRLRGTYIDVNEKHVSTLGLGSLAAGAARAQRPVELTDLAIYVFAAAAALYALLPVLLEYFGSDWKAVRVSRRGLAEG